MAFHDRPYYGSDGYGGGRPRIRIPMPGRGSVTMWLIIANFAVFFFEAMVMRIQHGQPPYAPGTYSWLSQWGDFSLSDGVLHGQVWRWVTYQYLHGGFGHIFFNMLVLFFFGPQVESYLGARRFFGYYTLCGFAGVLLSLVLTGLGQVIPGAERVPFLLIDDIDRPMIGASACVFGVLVAMLRIAPDQSILLAFILPVKIRFIVWVLILYEVYRVMVADTNNDNVGGNAAHLGGAILGAILIRKVGWLNFTERVSLRSLREGAARRSAQRSAKRQRVVDTEIDRILKKVSEQGLQSLTEKEKQTLRQATENKRNAG